MAQSHSASGQAQVLDTMIGLTRLSNLQRAMIAGRDATALCLGLRRRGFIRVATVSPWRIARQAHAVGLIADHDSPESIAKALSELSPFLCPQATIAILIDSHGSSTGLKVRSKLQEMGFRIEAGVRCELGLVLSAFRHGVSRMESAA